MHSFNVTQPSSATNTSTFASTSTSTSASTIILRGSQPESVTAQRPQGYFMGLSTTPHTPEELTKISSTNYQQYELRLSSDISASQVNPFEALATCQTVTLGDYDQGQSASCSSSLSIEPAQSQRSSQPVDDVAPIVREEQGPDPTDKWIMMSGDEKQPFQCGYEGCGKKYTRKWSLQRHNVSHNADDSAFRCYAGGCSGTVNYCDKATLTRHIHKTHTTQRPFGCEICDKRFKRKDHLKYHLEHLHSMNTVFVRLTNCRKNPPNPQSVPRLSSATTVTTTASTSTITSGVSQSGSASGQRLRDSFMGLSTTFHTPESMQTAASYHQQDGLRLLAEVSTSQINPFAKLATHQTVTFDDQAVTTETVEVPNLPINQYQEEQSPARIDKWIIVDKSQERPYKCGYPGCDKNYIYKSHLVGHFVVHTHVSKFKCTYPECVGKEYFRDSQMLKRHVISTHTLEKPFKCDVCHKKFGRKDRMKSHKKNRHFAEK